MKKVTIAAALAFVLGCTVTAVAAAPVWRVVATGTDAGTYGAYASASADLPRSHALAIRATSSPGKTIKVNMYLSCQADATVRSGAILAATTFVFQKCSLNGSANTDYSGRVKIELLRR